VKWPEGKSTVQRQGKTRLGLVEELKGCRILVELGTHGGRAIGTEIFIFVPFRQDKEQLFPHGDGSLTSRAIQRRCLKFLKA
jgi:hypothetical protein